MKTKKNLLCLVLLLIGVNIINAQSTFCDFDAKKVSYDIILVAGQSNTHYGSQLDPKKDTVNSRVYALGRHWGENYKINKATPVLDFWTRQSNKNSFATTFANLYVNQVIKENNRRLLIIPCGYAGSSIVSWSKGKTYYNDAIERVNYVLDNIPGSKVVAILWHQGEANVGWKPYQSSLDKMIVDMRKDIKQPNAQEVPFILGGMVPYWTNSNQKRKDQQEIIKRTPNRVINTGYADSEFPFVITKANNSYDAIHFDAAGQREMGKRYFNIFTTMKNNSIQTIEDNTENIEASNQLMIAPNPAIDYIVVASTTKKLKQVEIFNQNQRSMHKASCNSQSTVIQTSGYSKGMYVVRVIYDDNSTESKTIIKN